MIQRYDANGFPLPDVPTDGNFNVNFGGESNYALRGPKSAVSDLEAKAIANNAASTDRTPASGKYVYDSQTGQYIWVPATAAAPVGLAASPAYMNQDRGGRGDINPKEQDRINNLFDSYTSQDRVFGLPIGTTAREAREKDLKSVVNFAFNPLTSIYGALKDAFMGPQPKSMSEIGPFKDAKTRENDMGVDTSYAGGMFGDKVSDSPNAANAGDAVSGPAGKGGFGKPGETAVGGAVAPTATNGGLTSRGITSGVTANVDSAVDAAPPSDSETGKDTGADSVSGGGGGGGGARVICTHFYRKGEMDRDMWRADLEFTFKHLSPATIRGYQYWAIPYVKLMRKSKLAEDIIRPLAFARAKELAYKMDKSPKGSVFGKAVRLVCEPICFSIGLFVGEQNWQALWTPVKD
jgi:hypothetical protein